MANLYIIVELTVMLFKVIYHYILAFVLLVRPPKMKSVVGHVVVITGAGRGIGRELALQFALKGANLALWDIDENSVEETAILVKEHGVIAYSYVCDVTNVNQVKQVSNKVKRDLGDVDILVNNAGVMACKDIMSLNEGEIRRTFDINVVSHFWTIKEFLPKMMERNQGHIVTIASIAGKIATAYLTDYCGSKFGAVGLTESLRSELWLKKKTGVHLTVVCPKFVNTQLVTGISDRMGVIDRFGVVMDAKFVAESAIRGILCNRYNVYVPFDLGLAPIAKAVLPLKALKAIADVIQARFVDKVHED